MSLPRRRLLVAGGTALVVAAYGRPGRQAVPMLVDASEPLSPVEVQLAALEQRYNALVGFYGVNLNTGRTLDHRAVTG